MGAKAMSSPEYWGEQVKTWRKRESYSTSVCQFNEQPNLRRWTHFFHADYVQRIRLKKTFDTRHLPLSDGKDHEEFGGLLEVPEEWTKPKVKPKITRNTYAKHKGAAASASVQDNTPDASAVEGGNNDVASVASYVPMRYDFTAGKLVPVVAVNLTKD